MSAHCSALQGKRGKKRDTERVEKGQTQRNECKTEKGTTRIVLKNAKGRKNYNFDDSLKRKSYSRKR